MMNMESLIEAFICHLHVRPNGKSSSSAAAVDGQYTGRRHFLDDPKILPCCRQTACNKCVIKYAQNHPAPPTIGPNSNGGVGMRKAASTNSYDIESHMFYCPFCSNKFKFNVNTSTMQCDLESNESVSKEYDRNLIEINHYLVKKLENSMKNIEERLVSKETSMKKRKEYIRNEIRSQVDAIKTHLDRMEEEMLDTLDDSCKNIESSLRKFEQTYRPELEDKKILTENLKQSAFSYAYGLPVETNGGGEKNDQKKHNNKLSLTQQQMSVEKCIQSLNDLNHLNHTISEIIGELRFEPCLELPRKSIIGNLTKIKEVNLVEMFKTIKLESQINKIPSIKGSSQLMPISPRYLCIADPYNLFFTDSQTKQVIQLKLDTGDYVKSTNLSSLIKNPDGICVNTRTGHIYVSDHELKIIFKIDPQLKLVKKFATKELKWPRGMYYDSSESYRQQNAGDDMNHNCLYVCDYSNQRIAIFNSNEQLRDCLTIPINSNDPPARTGHGGGTGGGKDRSSANDDVFKKYDKQNLIEEECKFCPLNVLVTRNQILCTDDWTGGNCIRIFDKKTHMLLKNVGHLNVWDPLSLITDDWGNLFTIGRLYYETGATHLFCFNKDGELLYKVNLNVNSELITDMALDTYSDKTNYKLICAGEKRLYIFEFLHSS